MTEAERTMWRMLRSRQIGEHRFRRQVPLGPYIADFVCHDARLVIEVDGGQHDPSAAEEAERRCFLEGQGYRILRLWNDDVLRNAEGVWSTIAAELGRHHPLPTLPHRGGGLPLRRSPLLVANGEALRVDWRRFGEFTTTELYEALRLRQAAFVVEQASPYPDLDGCDRRALHLLLRVEDALAGYLRVIPHPDEHRVAIGRVAVAPPFRRRGFARLIMGEALSRCHRDYRGCEQTLSAQTYLVPFYETLGFRTVSPRYDDYGVPHVDMVREEK